MDGKGSIQSCTYCHFLTWLKEALTFCIYDIIRCLCKAYIPNNLLISKNGEKFACFVQLFWLLPANSKDNLLELARIYDETYPFIINSNSV